jgi:hypothetical protein
MDRTAQKATLICPTRTVPTVDVLRVEEALAGTVAQGVCFGVGMFPIALLLTWSLQAAWQLSVAVAVLFVIGLYPSNRWKHNRPERFLLESHDRH